MDSKVRTSNPTRILLIAGILIQAGFLYFVHSRVSFMLEDLDYLKDMATGEELHGLGGIFRNLAYVFQNLGGSLLTAFALQITLLLGEHFSDALNIAVMLFVSVLICRVIDARHQRFFTVGLGFSLIFCLNSDWMNSYIWQFGIVNYFYSVIWVLFYLYLFCRAVDSPSTKFSLKWGRIACVVGVAAGWSNGAYGLICIVISVLSLAINKYMLGKRHQNRLLYGMYGSIGGTVLYLMVPGNFHESSVMRGIYLSFSVFPAVILAFVMMAILLRTGGFLKTSQILMLGVLGGSVVLSLILTALPWFGPNGIQMVTLVLGITLFLSLMVQMNQTHPRYRIYGYAVYAVTLLHNILIILSKMVGVGA